MIPGEHGSRNGIAGAGQGRRRRVVILGGGFAGLHAARRLERTLAHRLDLEVVLMSRENYVLFTPMLHEVAAGDLDPADIVNPLRKMVRRVRLIQAEVEAPRLRTIPRPAVGGATLASQWHERTRTGRGRPRIFPHGSARAVPDGMNATARRTLRYTRTMPRRA